MKKRYTVIDHENGNTFAYSEIRWNFAFILIFVIGVLTGFLLFSSHLF